MLEESDAQSADIYFTKNEKNYHLKMSNVSATIENVDLNKLNRFNN